MSSTLLARRFTTSVAKELVVGLTGIALVTFVLGHLVGNVLLLVGPDVFNAYAARLHALGELLWAARVFLVVCFIAHIGTAISLALENTSARGPVRYEYERTASRKTFASRMMRISGVLILLFVLLHVYDFTLTGDREGPRSFVDGMGEESMGLYGVVFNSFGNPVRSLLYIICCVFVGIHLTHALASIAVTLGFLTDRDTGKAELVAKAIGIGVAAGFSFIPLYVLARTYIIGV